MRHRARVLALFTLSLAATSTGCELVVLDERTSTDRCDNTCVTADDGTCDLACASGTDCHDCGPPAGSGFRVGRFVDTNVEGLVYERLDGAGAMVDGPGHTGPLGQFIYRPGERVAFRAGPIVLGEARAGAVVTVQQLAGEGVTCADLSVTDRARLLLALDHDLDVSNGIQIGEETERSLYEWAGGQTMRVRPEYGADAFENTVIALLAALADGRSLASRLEAADHVGRSLSPPEPRLTATLDAYSAECERMTVVTGAADSIFGASPPVSTNECSTGGLRGLSTQIAQAYEEANADPRLDLVNISCFPGVILNDNSARELPYLLRPAAEALYAALEGTTNTLRINSALRTLPQQYALKNGCETSGTPVATPGSSNHEHGLAIDVQDIPERGGDRFWLDRLEASCFHRPLPTSDPVHFELSDTRPGCTSVPDVRADFIRAFQTLANAHGESIPSGELGTFGSQTEGALIFAPIDGYPTGWAGSPRTLRVFRGEDIVVLDVPLLDAAEPTGPHTSEPIVVEGGTHALRVVPMRENGLFGEPLATTSVTVEPCEEPPEDECVEDCAAGMACVDGNCVMEGMLRITLRWSAATDLDLHVREPDGAHVFYNARSGTDAMLDHDNTTGGAGSVENVFFTALTGPITYWVVNYDGDAVGDYTLEVVRGGATVDSTSGTIPATAGAMSSERTFIP